MVLLNSRKITRKQEEKETKIKRKETETEINAIIPIFFLPAAEWKRQSYF